jgi:hypothetical protein
MVGLVETMITADSLRFTTYGRDQDGAESGTVTRLADGGGTRRQNLLDIGRGVCILRAGARWKRTRYGSVTS